MANHIDKTSQFLPPPKDSAGYIHYLFHMRLAVFLWHQNDPPQTKHIHFLYLMLIKLSAPLPIFLEILYNILP